MLYPLRDIDHTRTVLETLEPNAVLELVKACIPAMCGPDDDVLEMKIDREAKKVNVLTERGHRFSLAAA